MFFLSTSYSSLGAVYIVFNKTLFIIFQIGDRIEMSLSHAVMDKSMNGNVSEYLKHLPAKIVENYNETVKCFERFQAAIAVVEVGKASEGSLSKCFTTHVKSLLHDFLRRVIIAGEKPRT